MKSESSNVNSADMASTEFFIHQFVPAKLRTENKIEHFILKCEEYFKVPLYSSSDAEILVKCFIEDDMLRMYNRVDSQISRYPAKLGKVFTNGTKLLESMRTALAFKQRNEDPLNFKK